MGFHQSSCESIQVLNSLDLPTSQYYQPFCVQVSGGLGLPTSQVSSAFLWLYQNLRCDSVFLWVRFAWPSLKLQHLITMHIGARRPSYESGIVRPSLDYINHCISLYFKRHYLCLELRLDLIPSRYVCSFSLIGSFAAFRHFSGVYCIHYIVFLICRMLGQHACIETHSINLHLHLGINKSCVQNGVKSVSLLGTMLCSPTKRGICRHPICIII